MKIVCAWCDTLMAEGDEPVSHGICYACFATQMQERPIRQEEWELCQRPPVAIISVDGERHLSIWYLPCGTVVHASWGPGWAFDCAMDQHMVLHHWKENLQ